MSKQKNYKAIIERIVNHHQEKLDDWELEFIASVYDSHVMGDRMLSEKQKEIILKINRELLEGRK